MFRISSLIYDFYLMTYDVTIFSALAQVVFQVYPKFGMALFCVTGYSITTMFVLLEQEIRELTYCSDSDVLVHLDRCRRRHVSIVNLIHNSNIFFGPVLLVTVACGFLEIVNSSFYLYLNWLTYKIVPSDIIFAFSSMIEIALLCYVTYQIQTKVVNFIWIRQIIIF